MISHEVLKRFMILWYTEPCIIRMVFREQSIEQAEEEAVVDKTDITNFDGRDFLGGPWAPQGVAETGVCDGKLVVIRVAE